MVKDFIGSFSDNLIERTKNPFLGTYALVWLVRNWVIVYTLFNFDSQLKMQSKIDVIRTHFIDNPFWSNLFINISLTLLLLVITYFFLNVSRTIVNFFEKVVTPWVYKITDKSSIVTKEIYNEALKRINDLETVVDNERKRRFEAENRADEIEKKLVSIQSANVAIYDTEHLEEEEEEAPRSTEEIEEEVNEFLKSSLEKGDLIIPDLYNKLDKLNKVESFSKLAQNLLTGPKKISFDDAEYRTFLLLSNILEVTGNSPYFYITQLGRSLLNYILSKKE